MADVRKAGEGEVRAAETLLRATGGRAVTLRTAQPAAGGDEAEQMGLSAPQFQDVELTPCVFRRLGSRRVLMVSAAAVKRVLGALDFDSAKVLFETAVGVVVDDELMEIEAMTPVESQGVAVCYRVTLQR